MSVASADRGIVLSTFLGDAPTAAAHPTTAMKDIRALRMAVSHFYLKAVTRQHFPAFEGCCEFHRSSDRHFAARREAPSRPQLHLQPSTSLRLVSQPL